MIQRGDRALFAFPVLRASGASEIAQSSRKRNGLEIVRIVCTQPPCFLEQGREVRACAETLCEGWYGRNDRFGIPYKRCAARDWRAVA
jgi:hypothetical protein